MPQKICNIWKSMAAGLAGGLVASWVMDETTKMLAPHNDQPMPTGPADPKVKVARAVKESVLKSPLSEQDEKTAGAVVHYATGGLSGALYGAVASVLPLASAGFGTLFGTAVFVAGEGVALPALGITGSPAKIPLPVQAQYLGGHLIYGAVTEAVRREILKVLA